MATVAKGKAIESDLKYLSQWRRSAHFIESGKNDARRGRMLRLGFIEVDPLLGSPWLRLSRSGKKLVREWNRGRPEATIGTHPPARSAKVAAKKRRKMPAATKRTLEGRFGVRLRELLDAKKWEVGDLYEQLKRFDVQVEKPAIHAWLRGDTMPKARDLEKIGQALGMSDYRQVLPPPG